METKNLYLLGGLGLALGVGIYLGTRKTEKPAAKPTAANVLLPDGRTLIVTPTSVSAEKNALFDSAAGSWIPTPSGYVIDPGSGLPVPAGAGQTPAGYGIPIPNPLGGIPGAGDLNTGGAQKLGLTTDDINRYTAAYSDGTRRLRPEYQETYYRNLGKHGYKVAANSSRDDGIAVYTLQMGTDSLVPPSTVLQDEVGQGHMIVAFISDAVAAIKDSNYPNFMLLFAGRPDVVKGRPEFWNDGAKSGTPQLAIIAAPSGV